MRHGNLDVNVGHLRPSQYGQEPAIGLKRMSPCDVGHVLGGIRG